MKKNYLLLVLLLLSLRSVAQNSFPLFAQKPEWRVDVTSFTSYISRYKFSNDTVVEGKTYAKIYNYLVRNEGKKTWIRSSFYTLPVKYSSEFLLYDFGLKQGDSVKVGPQRFGNTAADSTILVKVESVDSILINNVLRKRIKINYPRCGDYRRLSSMYWVEGIGALSNPFYAAECLCDGCESYYTLICFKLDSTPVYLNPNYSSCDYTRVGTNDVSAKRLKIYPNPFTQQLTLDNAESVNYVHLFSSCGQLLQTFQAADLPTIKVANVPNGLYWLATFDKQGRRLATQKVVKLEP